VRAGIAAYFVPMAHQYLEAMVVRWNMTCYRDMTDIVKERIAAVRSIIRRAMRVIQAIDYTFCILCFSCHTLQHGKVNKAMSSSWFQSHMSCFSALLFVGSMSLCMTRPTAKRSSVVGTITISRKRMFSKWCLTITCLGDYDNCKPLHLNIHLLDRSATRKMTINQMLHSM